MSPPLRPFTAAQLGQASLLELQGEWDNKQREKQEAEAERLRNGQDFAYRPQFYPWCRKHTEDPGYRREHRNTVTGEVHVIYQLCARLNPADQCPLHEPGPSPAAARPTARNEPRTPQTSPSERPDPSTQAPSPPALAAGTDGPTVTPADPALSAPPAAVKRIIVTGSIGLGEQLELHESAGAEISDSGFDPTSPVHSMLPAYRHVQVDISDDIREQDIAYSFRPTGKTLSIANQGLSESYGVFGQPGVGKTHLLIHLMQQLLELHNDDPARKFGALILDPKNALVDDVADMMARVGRTDDLVVINTRRMMEEAQSFNPLSTHLGPYDLGKKLVLSAQGAGIGGSDPFWFQAWTDIFGAALWLLNLTSDNEVTLQQLANTVLGTTRGWGGKAEPALRELVARAEARRDSLTAAQSRDLDLALEQVEAYLTFEKRQTVAAFINSGYGIFRRSDYDLYSPATSRQQPTSNLYDDILRNGKVVVVSIESGTILAKILGNVIKCLFQEAVLSRLDRQSAGDATIATRPVLLVADEYSEVATEVKGESIGDKRFFSLARQYGCMSLIATQSIHMLEQSTLGEAWKGVFSNFAAKIFLRVGDSETAEEASKLSGETGRYLWTSSTSFGKEMSSGTNRDLRDRKVLPPHVVTQVLNKGEAVVIGSLSSGKPGTYFVRVPPARPPSPARG